MAAQNLWILSLLFFFLSAPLLKNRPQGLRPENRDLKSVSSRATDARKTGRKADGIMPIPFFTWKWPLQGTHLPSTTFRVLERAAAAAATISKLRRLIWAASRIAPQRRKSLGLVVTGNCERPKARRPSSPPPAFTQRPNEYPDSRSIASVKALQPAPSPTMATSRALSECNRNEALEKL